MKFAWIICVFITICDAAKLKRTEFAIEPDNANRTQSLPKEKTDIKQAVEENVTRPPHSTPTEVTMKNLLKMKFQTKNIISSVDDSSFVTTTRRPLMRKRKFTSKPHAIYYIHSQTHGEQSNFSKRRNLNGKKRFKPQNKNKNTPNTSENSNSVEDRFKFFTDISDIGELEEDKKQFPTERKSNRRRGYLLASAASEQFKSVAHYTLPNADKYRSKSKSAIQESLQKIKSMRPELQEKELVISKTIPIIIVKNNITSSTEINTEKSTVTTSEKSVHDEITTQKFIHFTTLANKSVNSPNMTENNSTTTAQNIHKSLNKMEKSVNSATTSENLLDAGNTTENSGNTATTVKELETLLPKMNSNISAATTDKSIISTTTTQNVHESQNKMEKFVNFTTTTENILSVRTVNVFENKKEILDYSASTTANLDKSVTNTENPVHFANNSNKLDNPVTKTNNYDVTVEKSDKFVTEIEKPVQPVDLMEISLKYNSEKEKSVPLIIVTAKAISTDMNEDMKIVTSEKTPDPDINKKEKENIRTVTPIPNEEEILISTESVGNNLTLRRKRHINIIEEEKTATTSNGLRFTDPEALIDADLTYRNINT